MGRCLKLLVAVVVVLSRSAASTGYFAVELDAAARDSGRGDSDERFHRRCWSSKLNCSFYRRSKLKFAAVEVLEPLEASTRCFPIELNDAARQSSRGESDEHLSQFIRSSGSNFALGARSKLTAALLVELSRLLTS